MNADPQDLDATGVLAAAEDLVLEQRRRELEELLLVLRWADLHTDQPEGPLVPGGDRLQPFGGEGTPWVQEMCWAELAIARRAGLIATKHLAADALDLRHRLPLVWQTVQQLLLPAWVARKVAALSRDLSLEAVRIVDVAVAAAAHQAPGRIIAIAEAKVIEADPDTHRARLAADAARVGITKARPKPGDAVDGLGEPATGRMTLKLPHGALTGFDTTINDLAEAIYDQLPAEERETITRGQLETKAIELLSHPHAAAALLDAKETGEPAPPAKPRKRQRAVIYLHLSDLVLTGQVPGVARVEGIGPMLLEQLTELLAHTHIDLHPVIDLNHVHAVNGYEHPTAVKHRTLLRMLGDAFPHSTNTGYHRLDHDHAAPYVPPDAGGPTGQTGDHNDAPLTRTHHRVKTHQSYDVCQIALGVYRWVTPHGLGRIVTPTGTRKIEPLRARDGTVVGELYYPDSG